MSRYQQMHITNVHIADGFYYDCEDLVQQCVKLDILNFQSFCNIWKEMNFRSIYQRRTSIEIAELSEEVIYIGKRFMFKNTSNFKESLAGLYLVYALLTQQPYQNFAWLRVTPQDVPAIQRLENTIRNYKQNDALYILGTILIKHTQYHIVERERGFDAPLKKYLDGCLNLKDNGIKSIGIFKQQNDEPDLLKELGTIARRYTMYRDRVNENCKDISSMKYVNENLPSELAASLRIVVNGSNEDDTHDTDDSNPTALSIKQRAMMSTVNSVGHLMTILETNEENIPQKISKVESISKKKKYIKTEKKTLRPFIFFGQGNADTPKSNLSRKRKKTESSSSDIENSDTSETDLSLEPIGEIINTSITEPKDKIDKIKQINSCEDEKNKKYMVKDSNIKMLEGRKVCSKKYKSKEATQLSEKLEYDENSSMSKDSIPAIIQSEDGNTVCEIEIIDYSTNKMVSIDEVLKDIFQKPSEDES